MVFESLLGGYEEIPLKGYGGCEMRFVVWNGKDVFGRATERTFIKVDLESFCKKCQNILATISRIKMCTLGRAIPSAVLTCTSFQNLFVLAVPPPVPAATALKSCPLFSNSACFRRLATLESTCSALAVGGAGGGPDAVVGATEAVLSGEVCMSLWANGHANRELDELRSTFVLSAKESRFILCF